MTIGPCLCGDPYCPSCGDPGAAAYEAAVEAFVEEIDKLGMSDVEFEVFKTVGFSAIESMRKANQVLKDEYESEKTIAEEMRL